MKFVCALSALFFSVSLFANPANVTAPGEVILNEQKKLDLQLNMFKREPQAACEKRNMHLPTIEEWIAFATGHGAQPAVPTAFPGVSIEEPQVLEEIKSQILKGFRPTLKFTENSLRTVELYYSNRGYQNPFVGIESLVPDGMNFNESFYSGSISDPGFQVYVFNFQNGSIQSPDFGAHQTATLCFESIPF